jgi:heme/copper-type cytochrome/quinol oxidase subunit 2
VETITFTPDKVGQFPFFCTVWCSPRHEEMCGVLVVE